MPDNMRLRILYLRTLFFGVLWSIMVTKYNVTQKNSLNDIGIKIKLWGDGLFWNI